MVNLATYENIYKVTCLKYDYELQTFFSSMFIRIADSCHWTFRLLSQQDNSFWGLFSREFLAPFDMHLPYTCSQNKIKGKIAYYIMPNLVRS